MTKNPELDFFMNESESDVIFMIEGQPLPSQKLFLRIKSKVFRAMFSGDFKESKDKEIVIEDTTYEAFKTFIRFLYCEDLVLKDDNDFEMFGELCKLCDRYDVSRLMDRITHKLYEKCLKLFESKEDFKDVWPKMQSISKIAFELKIEKLMDKVMEFIEQNFDHFIDEDNEVLIQLNDSTDGRLFTLMAEKLRKERKERKGKLYGFNEYNCQNCHRVNLVPSEFQFFYCVNCSRQNTVM